MYAAGVATKNAFQVFEALLNVHYSLSLYCNPALIEAETLAN